MNMSSLNSQRSHPAVKPKHKTTKPFQHTYHKGPPCRNSFRGNYPLQDTLPNYGYQRDGDRKGDPRDEHQRQWTTRGTLEITTGPV